MPARLPDTSAALPWFEQPFALLDSLAPEIATTSATTTATARSRLYTGLRAEHRCTDPATLEACWAAVEADQQRGWHALLLADYEWGVALQGLPACPTGPTGEPGALRVLMFEHLARLSAEEVAALLVQADGGQAEPSPAGCTALQASVAPAEFDAAIAAIHEAIAAGETYQVNFTYRLTGRAFGAPAGLYRRLRARQPAAFAAWLALPEPGAPGSALPNLAPPRAALPNLGPPRAALRQVLSLSPELFLQVQAGEVLARPMKGTAPRDLADRARDQQLAQALAADVKNRAENLMIVDLLRNDLGRVAQLGSVRVPALFATEAYPSVWQMTSTIQARLRPEIDLPALLRASFPCGSITGAPKRQTMALISQLESRPRGLYCGAIGWADAPAPGQRIGDLCLSVAIRTLELGACECGWRRLTMGVGAGIVQDSVAAAEQAECALKARFLTELDPGFELFETLPAEAGVALGLDDHLARMAASAAALGFKFERHAAERLVHEAAGEGAREAALAGGVASGGSSGSAARWRLRLALRKDGALSVRRAPLAELPMPLDANSGSAPVAAALPGGTVGGLPWAAAPAGAVLLRLSRRALPEERPLAGHKTSLRAAYDLAVQEAEAVGAFDSLLFSASGYLLEGGRSNVLACISGQWFTPPLSDGVLPGVMRARLLADPRWNTRWFMHGKLQERSIHRSELAQVSAWAVCNALRGVLPARLIEAPEA